VTEVTLLLLLIFTAGVAFDFINGFHDTANAIATVVSTRVLSLRTAILMAAAFNIVGALTGTAVAKTVGAGLVDTNAVTQTVVLSALVGAIIWNLITWYFGIPSSSSHALIGGLLGAGAAHAGGFGVWEWSGIRKAIEGLIESPIIGFFGGFLLIVLVSWLTYRLKPAVASRLFRGLQLVSSAFMAFSHGSNDAQKTMGIITLSLFSAGFALPLDEHGLPNIPLWVIIVAATAMAAGTAVGGWRIIHTMGERIVHLEPIHGFAAETTAATIIETASRLGFPLSTTHVISSCILGVGAARRLSAVRWGVAFNIVRAWIFTIPVTGGLAFLTYMLLDLVL
jgi:PiT family inorganic phosphate transporter